LPKAPRHSMIGPMLPFVRSGICLNGLPADANPCAPRGRRCTADEVRTGIPPWAPASQSIFQ
jgi:hypothetical protein